MQHKLSITIGLLAALSASSTFAFNTPCPGKQGAIVGGTSDGKLGLATASLSVAAVPGGERAPAAAKDTLAPVPLVAESTIRIKSLPPINPMDMQSKATAPTAPVGAGTTATTATCSCPCDQKAATPASNATPASKATPASTAIPTSLEQFGPNMPKPTISKPRY